MAIKYSLLFYFILQVFLISAQDDIPSREQLRATSEKQIKELSNSVLLVRLSSKKNTIDAMRKVGKIELAEKTIKKRDKRNKEIIRAFRNHFSFCPVYFFYNTDSKLLKDKQLGEVEFLDDSLNVDNSIKITNEIFYVAEFGITAPDNTRYVTETYYENGKKKQKHYSGSGITLTGLIIKDDQIEQLKEPFPYYVRERKGMMIFQKRIADVVLKMNTKLNAYLEKINKN